MQQIVPHSLEGKFATRVAFQDTMCVLSSFLPDARLTFPASRPRAATLSRLMSVRHQTYPLHLNLHERLVLVSLSRILVMITRAGPLPLTRCPYGYVSSIHVILSTDISADTQSEQRELITGGEDLSLMIIGA